MSEKIRKLEAAHKYAAHRRYYRKEMQALFERSDLFLKALQELAIYGISKAGDTTKPEYWL